MKKFNKLLKYAPGGGLSKIIQKRLDKCDYSVQSQKEFSQVVTIYHTFCRYSYIKTYKTYNIYPEDDLLITMLRQCDYNAMWNNKEIIKQIVTRIKFLREKCNI